MIERIQIRGLGVIVDATIPFSSGLTVITGETGAGKTMVLSGFAL
ncbi:MAG: AAA family ATPase, partial [Actinobacteria bacterium]|nr:AAA family ATPase [Actinomycetota bacterium]